MGKIPNKMKKNVDIKAEYTNSLFNLYISEKQRLGRVPETIQAYKTAYKKFCDCLGEQAEMIGDISYSLFLEWIAIMQNEGLAATTINHNLEVMRGFMYWCMDDERKYIDERFKIKLVKTQEAPPKDYELEEVELLLKKPDRNAKYTEWRGWAICSFIIGTGARSATIRAIRMCDVDLKRAEVFYQHTKNRKIQSANIPPQLVKVLTEYINMWRHDANEEDYLFCNIGGEELNRVALKSAYREYTKSRGVDKTNLHGLRHTFAREWYYNGGDVVQLSRILGHSSIRMSEHYMNVYATDMKDKFNQHNPLENMRKATNRRQTITRK